MHMQFPDRPLDEINSLVWHERLARLRAAIKDGNHFAFEITLGSNTITKTLLQATSPRVPVNIWYCRLASAELHIERE